MFEQLSSKLQQTFKTLSGQARITENNIQVILREIRVSLLEADVDLSTIKTLLENVKTKALGEKVEIHLNSEQAFLKIVHEELIHILGDERIDLNLKTAPPAIFLLAGLQGSGKTTTAAKLARYLKETEKKKIMLVSLDVYRPAARDQLEALVKQLDSKQEDIRFYPSDLNQTAAQIATAALATAQKNYSDVVIFDTAGRMHLDENMMQEIKNLHHILNPIETLFVVDSMSGQDAAITAKAFHEAIPLTGVILTKTDGDARGGAALSVKYVTGKPIKFIGSGEKIDALEPFYPERIASRILGMGDLLSLIEDVERKADKKANEKLSKKFKKNKTFDLNDFSQQLSQVSNMGINSILSKLPNFGTTLPAEAMSQINDKSIKWKQAILSSMTLKEKRHPQIIIGSRKKRIALGSGTSIPEVNKLLKEFKQMQKMMGSLKNPKELKNLMHKLKNVPGLNNLLGNFKN